MAREWNRIEAYVDSLVSGDTTNRSNPDQRYHIPGSRWLDIEGYYPTSLYVYLHICRHGGDFVLALDLPLDLDLCTSIRGPVAFLALQVRKICMAFSTRTEAVRATAGPVHQVR